MYMRNMDLLDSAPINDSFNDEGSGTNSFSIQPYQFEPRRNSDKSESDNESISGEESEEENTNPRLENSDWYVNMRLRCFHPIMYTYCFQCVRTIRERIKDT